MARDATKLILPHDGVAKHRLAFAALAKQKFKLDDKYENAYWEFRKSINPLALPKFWQMVSVLKELVYERKDQDDPAENAVDEFFRLAHVAIPGRDRQEHTNEYTFADCIAFSVRWDDLNLYDALFDIVEGKSDDSYGDLIDSLPFAGEKFILRCQQRGFKNFDEFKSVLKKTVGAWWYEYIYDGENYIGMKLDDEAKDRIPNALSC